MPSSGTYPGHAGGWRTSHSLGLVSLVSRPVGGDQHHYQTGRYQSGDGRVRRSAQRNTTWSHNTARWQRSWPQLPNVSGVAGREAHVPAEPSHLPPLSPIPMDTTPESLRIISPGQTQPEVCLFHITVMPTVSHRGGETQCRVRGLAL